MLVEKLLRIPSYQSRLGFPNLYKKSARGKVSKVMSLYQLTGRLICSRNLPTHKENTITQAKQ